MLIQRFFFPPLNAGPRSFEHCRIWDVIGGCAGTVSSSAGEQFRDKQKAGKMQLVDLRSVCGSAVC